MSADGAGTTAAAGAGLRPGDLATLDAFVRARGHEDLFSWLGVRRSVSKVELAHRLSRRVDAAERGEDRDAKAILHIRELLQIALLEARPVYEAALERARRSHGEAALASWLETQREAGGPVDLVLAARSRGTALGLRPREIDALLRRMGLTATDQPKPPELHQAGDEELTRVAEPTVNSDIAAASADAVRRPRTDTASFARAVPVEPTVPLPVAAVPAAAPEGGVPLWVYGLLGALTVGALWAAAVAGWFLATRGGGMFWSGGAP